MMLRAKEVKLLRIFYEDNKDLEDEIVDLK